METGSGLDICSGRKQDTGAHCESTGAMQRLKCTIVCNCTAHLFPKSPLLWFSASAKTLRKKCGTRPFRTWLKAVFGRHVAFLRADAAALSSVKLASLLSRGLEATASVRLLYHCENLPCMTPVFGSKRVPVDLKETTEMTMAGGIQTFP